MVTRFKKAIKLVGNLFLLYFSILIPKDKKLWVFGSWFGKKYTDNSRYLFEYVLEKEPDIRAVWLTHDRIIYQNLKKKCIPVYYINSLKGYWICCRSSIAFFSQGTWDVNRLGLFRTIKVQLWHGYPNKKNATKVNLSERNSILKKLKLSLLKPHHWYDFTISSNGSAGEIRANSFDMEKDQVILSGYPRTDIILSKSKGGNYIKKKKVIGFFPTYRPYDFKLFENDTLDHLRKVLKKYNMSLIVKLHPADNKIFNFVSDEDIIFLEDTIDVNDILADIDILLTDYSSIYFDYLILNRPIIFTSFDQKEYISRTGGFWDNFNERAGKHCVNWREVIQEIELLNEGGDYYEQKRLESINKIYKHVDTENRKRLVDFFKSS